MFFRAKATFTAKSIDDASQINGSATGDYAGALDSNNNLNLDQGPLRLGQGPQTLLMNFTYETPAALVRLLRGWQLAGSGRMSSGMPFTVLQNGTIAQGITNRPGSGF